MTRHFRVHTLTTMAWIWESSAVSTHPHTSSPSLIPPPPPPPPQLKTAGGGNTSPHPQPGAGRPGRPAEARDALDGGYLQGPAAVPQDQRPEGGRGPKGGAEHSPRPDRRLQHEADAQVLARAAAASEGGGVRMLHLQEGRSSREVREGRGLWLQGR